MEKENKMPELEAIVEQAVVEPKGVKEGLEAIIKSEDIDEIKSIANSLLGMVGDDKEEVEVDDEVSMSDYMGRK